MKVAVASSDGVSISEHFGRSKCFIIFEIEADKVKSREVRENSFTAFARGECQEQGHSHQPHSHSSIINALQDCQAVLCYGMGLRAAEELRANGIEPFILPAESSPENAVSSFLKGELKSSSRDFCRCHK